jgi:ribosome-associated protein
MQTEALKKTALKALEDLKGTDITEFDVRDLTSVTDVMIIASGTSDRHVKSLADAVVMACKKAGVAPLGVEGEREGEWVLVDLGDVVVHVMQPRIREFYALEKLWSVTEENRERESGGPDSR